MLEDIAVILVSTLVSGSVYTLMVIGLTLILDTIEYLNFAHGVYFTFGAYLIWYLLNITQINFWIAIIILIPSAFLLGYLTQRFIIQRLVNKEASSLVLILATFCIGSIIESIILIIFGGRIKMLTPPFEGFVDIAGATMSYHKILIFGSTMLLMVIFTFILYKTKNGIAMRSIAQDREVSYLMGINVGQIYAIIVGLSAILASIGGWLMGSLIFLTPTFGGDILWKGFIVVTLAGRRAGLTGSLLSSFFVAFVETTLQRFLPMYDVPPILFAIVIAGLLIKPEGLFKRK